jgi:hypothetical protein
MARCLIPLAAAAALAAASSAALAAGPYDGTWIIDFPPSLTGSNATQPACQALRLHFEVKDSQVSARLQRVSPEGNVVENSTAPGATPVTGSVKADGTVEGNWGDFTATGRLAGSQAQVTVKGVCGERTGTGVRVG